MHYSVFQKKVNYQTHGGQILTDFQNFSLLDSAINLQ